MVQLVDETTSLVDPSHSAFSVKEERPLSPQKTVYEVIPLPPLSGAVQDTCIKSDAAIKEVTGAAGIAGIWAARIETVLEYVVLVPYAFRVKILN